MTNITEHFIKGSDNVITLTLEEDDVAITGSWSALNIHFCNPADPETAILTITRASSSNGIALSSGVLTIRPRALSETLTDLIAGRLYRIFVKVTDATTNTVGAYFGEEDSTERLYFLVTDPP